MSAEEGKILKEEGMDLALSNADYSWKEEFRDVVLGLLDGKEFTSEDVIEVVGLPNGGPGLHKNNAVGAVMAGLAKQGHIAKTGRHVSSRTKSSHAAELTVWTRTR